MPGFTLGDVLAIEGENDEIDGVEALQRAINSGMAWSFQGCYGRAMMAAIDDGLCMLGTQPARDYWGNRIPSRTEVKPGAKGSREYVVAHQGEAHAKRMEGV